MDGDFDRSLAGFAYGAGEIASGRDCARGVCGVMERGDSGSRPAEIVCTFGEDVVARIGGGPDGVLTVRKRGPS